MSTFFTTPVVKVQLDGKDKTVRRCKNMLLNGGMTDTEYLMYAKYVPLATKGGLLTDHKSRVREHNGYSSDFGDIVFTGGSAVSRENNTPYYRRF